MSFWMIQKYLEWSTRGPLLCCLWPGVISANERYLFISFSCSPCFFAYSWADLSKSSWLADLLNTPRSLPFWALPIGFCSIGAWCIFGCICGAPPYGFPKAFELPYGAYTGPPIPYCCYYLNPPAGRWLKLFCGTSALKSCFFVYGVILTPAPGRFLFIASEVVVFSLVSLFFKYALSCKASALRIYGFMDLNGFPWILIRINSSRSEILGSISFISLFEIFKVLSFFIFNTDSGKMDNLLL